MDMVEARLMNIPLATIPPSGGVPNKSSTLECHRKGGHGGIKKSLINKNRGFEALQMEIKKEAVESHSVGPTGLHLAP